MATISGTEFDDRLPGTRFADVIWGGDGNDVLNGISVHNMVGAGNDSLYGGNGADTLYGGNDDDLLFGEAGDDTLLGGNGNDHLSGGAGNDTMSGGPGDDVFVFNFETTEVTSSTPVTLSFRNGHQPSEQADYAAWNNYESQLTAWRTALESRHGTDQVAAETYTAMIETHGRGAGKPDAALSLFSGDDTFTYFQTETRTATTGEGYDTILDWDADHDRLVLTGLSADSDAHNYWGKVLSVETEDDLQTVISFEGGSITLIGVDTTLDALIASGDLLFA